MKKSAKPNPLDERPALDFSKGLRGKYANLLNQGTNVVILDPELMPFFPNSASVNRALHAFLAINKQIKSAEKDKPAATRTRSRRRPASSESTTYDPRIGSEPVSVTR